MFTNHKIKILSKEEKEDFYCNICDYPYLTIDDFNVKLEYLCCHECYLTFAEARREKWKKGWRPKQEVIDNYVNSE